MVHVVENQELNTRAHSTLQGYNDRYRLTNETVVVGGSSSTSTSYAWDHADNRLSKIVRIAGGPPATTSYTNNALNQMTG